MSYTPILNNPIEWDDKEPNKCKEPFCGAYLDMNDYDDICINCYNQVEPEQEKCTLCHNDLTNEEIKEQDDDNKFCNDCFYSCCGDELNQDVRICPTCKEHN